MSQPWDRVPLVDHHCHGLLRDELDLAGFESMMNEADGAGPLGTTLFDSLLGMAVRRWCAPVLDLPAHTEPDEYLTRRAELGTDEVNRRFLAGTGITDYLVDGGYRPELLTSSASLGALAGARAHDIVRLELLAEDVVRAGTSGPRFVGDCTEALAKRATTAVGCKSIAAYRVGLRLAGGRPSDAEVAVAADRWLSDVDQSGVVRMADPVLHRFLVWLAIEQRLPVQFHVGYGDADVDLGECDPLLLTDLLRATMPAGVPILLLHNYPFHRHAGYLAQVFPHVFMDVGLATHNVGFRAGALIAEALELAPFGKFLFSSDAFGLAEHYHLGTLLFRRGLSEFLGGAVAHDEMTSADAVRAAELIGSGNARRVYGLSAT
ncbi:MAG TPA: amidohydrolase family protein [Pseudonocardiaceae bacterium]|nr:amidohydrolase family protein [Pseudonocardiaceae bacterium]